MVGSWHGRRRRHIGRLIALLTAVVTILPMVGAAAHEEREVTQPPGAAFPEYRDTGPSVVVCKPDSGDRIATQPAAIRARNEGLLEDCQFEHIQAAVDWVAENGQPGSRILVLPGVYREEPSRQAHEQLNGAPVGASAQQAQTCGDIRSSAESEGRALTYEEAATCPHIENLIAVYGDTTPADDNLACDGNLCDLQIEGTGVRPGDVVSDGKLNTFLNGLRGDRADGLYIKNFVAQHFEFNGVYVIETNGATADAVWGNFNHEYGFLSFEAFMRYENCGGQTNGDSAVYPGASPETAKELGLIPSHRDDFEPSTEVRGCRGHHNALGYSGTTGNSVWAHHNEFDHNSAGFATDSLFPGHPGTPQNHLLLENNLIHENNTNYYVDARNGECTGPLDERDYEDGVVCPAIPLPVGTGFVMAGGNLNWVHGNDFFDNWRQGTFQFWVPAELREEAPDPDAHLQTNCGENGDQPCPPMETSHWNTYSSNRLAENPQGFVQPNGADFGWDASGQGNCWDQSGDDANTSAAGDVTYRLLENPDAPTVTSAPDCGDEREATFLASSNVFEAGCIQYDAEENPDPAGCDWFDTPTVPAGREPGAVTLERLAGADRIETAIRASREGYPTAAPTVVLARADLYPDALAGAPLAHARGGPLLLTSGDGLDARVADEIQRLGATSVVLLGGQQALSDAVVSDLTGLGFASDDIVRISGGDRFETAANIARAMPATDAFVAKGVDADGSGWADALAASSVAALLERPILLTAPDTLPASTDAFLAEGDIESVDIAGGTAAVSAGVESQLASRLDKVERVAGPNRFETSLELAKFALKAGADSTELWLATGTNWPDGIAAGSAVAVDEGILLLVGDELTDTPAAEWLDEVHPFLDDDGDSSVADVLERVRILGGTAAVPAQVAADLRDGYGAVDGDAKGDRSSGNRVWNGRLVGDASGSVWASDTIIGSTRLKVAVTGLEPGTTYNAHLGTASCADGGGAHRPFAGGGDLHLAFTANADGVAVADGTMFDDATAAPRSVTVHVGDDVAGCADIG